MAKETLFGRMVYRIQRFTARIQLPESLVLLGLAILVGAITGILAIMFIRLVELVSDIASRVGSNVASPIGDAIYLILVMGLAGLIVGWIVNRWAIEAKGTGIPEVMEAVALHGGRIRHRVAPLKMLVSSITIGAGGSAGRIGPVVQIGSSLGSSFGQLLGLSNDKVRTLVACGAAGGVAATFNAPIAGAIFALEVILGHFSISYFGAVVLSAVSADVVSRYVLGDQPVFVVPIYRLNSFSELPIYVLLAVLSALVAVIFIRSLQAFSSLFDRIEVHPAFAAALGMVLTALIITLLPDQQVKGVGLGFIGEIISLNFSSSILLLFALLMLKILATSLTLGSGNSGGVFAPSLFLGAMLGGTVGLAANALAPDVAAFPQAYAIVGMASVFAGATRAPITSVLLVFEMSNDYRLILPLMLAAAISTLLADFLYSESIYTVKLRAKGITLPQGHDLDLMKSITVKDTLSPSKYKVDCDMPLTELGRRFEMTHEHSFPVVDESDHLVGMVSITDYERVAQSGGAESLAVKDIATMGNILTAYEDESVSDVMQRIAVWDIHQLPVVSRKEPDRLIGVVRRRDVAKAYQLALTRRGRQEALDDRESVIPIDETEFLEFEIPAGSQASNKTLAELAGQLPHDSVIICVRRAGMVTIPHGDTILQPGDLVSVFLRNSDENELRKCLLGE